MRMLSFSHLKSVKGIPYSRMHVDRLEKMDRFPKRVHLSPGAVVWVEAEIDKWLNERITARSCASSEGQEAGVKNAA